MSSLMTPISHGTLHAISTNRMEKFMTKFLTSQQVSEMVSLSISQIRRMVKTDAFPQPLKISPGRSAWLEKDIQQWMKSLMMENGND